MLGTIIDMFLEKQPGVNRHALKLCFAGRKVKDVYDFTIMTLLEHCIKVLRHD
jgi:hypothetical protein